MKINRDACIEEAKKYTTASEWFKNSRRTYCAAMRNKWLGVCEAHMNNGNLIWTKEKLIKTAKQFDNITEFNKNYPSAYARGKTLGITDEMFSHIKTRKEIIFECAEKCTTIKEFRLNYKSHYSYSNRHGFIYEVNNYIISRKVVK